MIEAMKADRSFNPKALCAYMGHASIQTTYDRYGKMFPGNEDEAAALLDAYLVRADTQARVLAVEASGESEE